MTVRITPLPEPTAPPSPDGGLGALRTEKGNLPLDSVDVRVAVSGLAASVTVVQGFRNPFDVPLEATYVFPLPDRAAVTSLRMETADRVVDGVLKERGQARQEYDAALASGRRAAIAEEDRPDVFTMRVGNILPGERVTVRLVLTQPLPFESVSVSGGSRGEATFRFPLVVAPRYIPGTSLGDEAAGTGVAVDTDAVPDASRITPPVLLPGFPNPVALSLAVDIDAGALPLTEIRSALHVVAEDTADGHTTVRLHPDERLNRDFILRLVFDTPAMGTASLTLTPDAEGDEGVFSLTVLPSAESGHARPRDVVLVLDRSFSMDGWKMVAARRAAARIVDTFTPADGFAVLSFDNLVESPPELGPGLSPGTDRNRFRAVEHLATLSARGGTEMLAPLEQACALLSRSDSGRDRVLVLVTDGQVGNEDQILDRLQRKLHGVRVHTVGIDRAVNAGFLNRLASVGGGRCELVESEDRLDEAMERVHHRVGTPLMTDLSLSPDGLDLLTDTIAPHRLGAIFPGVPLVVTGRFRGAPTGSLALHGRSPDGSPREHRALGLTSDAPMASALWARAHLRDLEDRYAVSGSAELEDRIVKTSLRFSVLCRFTAFVAIDSQVVTEGRAPHQVTQPVEVPDGWTDPTYQGAPAPYGSAAPASASYGASAIPLHAPGAPAAPSGPPAPARPRARIAAPLRGSSRRPVGGGARLSNHDDMDVPDFLKSDSASAPHPPAPPNPPSPSRPMPPEGSASSPGRAQPPNRPIAPAPQRRPAPNGEHSTGEASAEVTRRLKAELDQMRSVPEADRSSHLGTRLLPFLTWLLSSDLVLTAPVRASLAALAQKVRDLREPAKEVAPPRATEVWQQAIHTLEDLTSNTPTSRAPFWKRPK
ncbi:VIT domain-containing protein [Actinomadura harenae]|uniref:VWA domain-containing protein n=1 Tax=Actinomadura harenae TaxID=2483351 RepID=A0A3M2M8L4_9ACTN|nr:VIT domain-containing protein [Actinomadura harenae]RMI45330.1 VWA domain-containing protein [Actinomadura harenae]